MKLLHTSDWHLGMTVRGGISYGDDQMFAINKICETAVSEKADAVLIAGDIFDKSIATRQALAMYDEIMTRICGELGIPVIIIAGNHDGAERIAGCRGLLKKSGLFIAGALEKIPQKVTFGDTDIYMLPWITTEKVKTVYPENAEEIDSMESAYRVVLDKYRETFERGKRNVLLAHAYAANAETSVSDRTAEIGRAAMVSASVFEGFDYVALGHLHGPQKVNKHIRYSGSPVAYSFGKEEKQVKSVVLVDTETMEQKIIPIPQLRKRVTLSGTHDELMKADVPEDILNGYVRLEVTDSYVGMDSIAAFREKYINLLEVSGKDFEREDAKITMTISEFEDAERSPGTVFRRYCEDILESEPDRHLEELFNNALAEYEREEESR